MSQAQRLTKRQRRLSEKGTIKKIPLLQKQHFELKPIEPMTKNQELVFEDYDKDLNLFLLGCAGTGKTYISIYLALLEILEKKTNKDRLVIIRNTQSSKDQGFLPGDEKQKAEVFEAPYKAICADLFHRDDAYEILKSHKVLEFHTTSYLRGTTIDNAIILIDEAQNQKYSELRTVLTRVGENSRIIICGDTKQDDLTSARFKEQSGLPDVIKIFECMEDISCVFFDVVDIVRSGFVRSFIETEYKLIGY